LGTVWDKNIKSCLINRDCNSDMGVCALLHAQELTKNIKMGITRKTKWYSFKKYRVFGKNCQKDQDLSIIDHVDLIVGTIEQFI
jgi:hypothetical protein